MVSSIVSYGLFAVAFCAVAIFGYVTITDPDPLFLGLSGALGLVIIAASVIDFRTHTLPNWLTLPLIAAGLLQAWFLPYTDVLYAVVGAISGYLLFWIIGEVYFSARGREGLGLGDAKLLAAGGAWTGWIGLAPIVLIGSGLGLLVLLLVPILRREETAFGPWLGIGIWTVWLVGIGGGWMERLVG